MKFTTTQPMNMVLIIKLGSIALALALSNISCAPSLPAQQTSLAPALGTQTQANPQQTANVQQATSAASPKPNVSPVSPSATPSALRQISALSSMTKSQVPANNLRSSTESASSDPSEPTESDAASPSDTTTFDGKSPFSDDSLWQIPFQLVRDLAESPSSQEGGKLVVASKGPSETNAAAFDGEDESEAIQAAPSGPKSAQAASSARPTSDLKTAADYHHPAGAQHGAEQHHDKYFQYAGVPHPGAWEFGYRRGNPYHTIERYEHAKGPHFQTKVKWSDKHAGYGVHVWDYNHGDHHDHHYNHDKDEHHAPAHQPAAHHYGHH